MAEQKHETLSPVHNAKIDLANDPLINSTSMARVYADVQRFCLKYANSVVEHGTNIQECTEWPFVKTVSSPSGTSGIQMYNHLDFIVRQGDCGELTVCTLNVMTYDMCLAALTVEVAACERGSNQNHNGIYWRIDPGHGPCPKPQNAQAGQ